MKAVAMSEQDQEEKKDSRVIGMGMTSLASATDSFMMGENNQVNGN